MRALPLAVLTLLLVSTAFATESEQLPERITRSLDGITIEYSVGDEAYVDAFVDAFPRRPRGSELAAAKAESHSMALLEQNRDALLRYAAAQLAMKEPSAKMREGYDNFTRLFRTMKSADAGTPRRFALWRRTELRERLRRGETIPNFKLTGDDEIDFSFGWEAEKVSDMTDDDLTQRWRVAWAEITLPISIGKDPDNTPVVDIAVALKQHDEIIANIRQMRFMEAVSPFIVMHEAVEMAIIDRYIVSTDRRWFCDGVANYVAFRALKRQFGTEVAKQHYDLEAELKKFASERPNIDLEKWPAAEDEMKMGYRKSLSTANYAFATKVIADICAKHGDAILPKLFAEIGKTPREKTNMKTVRKAFKKLTREDLRRYLPKPEKTKRA